MKKKFLCTVLAAIMAISSFSMFGCAQEEEVEEFDPNVLPDVGGISQLPVEGQVSRDANPIMYDYINGALGMYWDHDVKQYGQFYAVARKQDGSDNYLYVSRYAPMSPYALPCMASVPTTINTNENIRDMLDAEDKNMDKDHRFIEDGWVFYMIETSEDPVGPWQCDTAGNWLNGMICFENITFDTENSWIYQEVEVLGHGWPTAWLRKSWAEEMSLYQGIDINDPFWDRFNYAAYYEILPLSGSEHNMSIMYNCTATDVFKTASLTGYAQNSAKIDEMANEYQTIEEAADNRQFVKVEDFEDRKRGRKAVTVNSIDGYTGETE